MRASITGSGVELGFEIQFIEGAQTHASHESCGLGLLEAEETNQPGRSASLPVRLHKQWICEYATTLERRRGFLLGEPA
jgi:hypothetical protein